MSSGARPTTAWDLTAVLNAADGRASLPERHLWLVRLMEWLRHDRRRDSGEAATPSPLVRLRHLLRLLDQHASHAGEVRAMLQAFWREVEAPALFADFGFAHRVSLRSELWRRLRERVLPASPATRDLAALFPLLFEGEDAAWLEQLDEATLQRLGALMQPGEGAPPWRRMLLDATTILASAVHAAGFSPALRQRMSVELLADEPFRQLPAAVDRVRSALLAGDKAAALREALYLRALLDSCVRAADSIAEHLEEFGISVDIAFEADQLRGRCRRIEALLDCVLAERPARELQRLAADLARVAGERHGVRRLLARHYSQLARLLAERSAETGEHYIARSRDDYLTMLRRASGGGAILAGTTLLKFAVAALALGPFWNGLWSGLNYAASFTLIMLLHYTVATKQPASTAPAMAQRLAQLRLVPREGGGVAQDDAAVEGFVDQVTQLIRSQAAGILGNLALCAPLVLAVQWGGTMLLGTPPVGAEPAGHVLHSLTLLGPTALYAALTGVLLFASSLLAGWVENWFVFHRLDSAIAWSPRIVARLGAPRAQRWARWWTRNVSGLTANVSLGLMLGLVPAVAVFFGLPFEVRHVTLSAGQLAAALGALGPDLLAEPAFWWCLAGIAVTGALNVAVSFWLAFKVALRSRGIRLRERERIRAALRHRLLRAPLSFVLPPRAPTAAQGAA